MTHEIVGALFVLTASVLIGLDICSLESEKIKQGEELCALLRHIRSNIDFFLTPVDEILHDYSSPALDRCGFTSVMKEKGLKTALQDGGLTVRGKTIELLSAFSDELGAGYREDELKRCDYYIEKLNDENRAAAEKFLKNKKMYKYLPPLCVLSIIILFI